MMLELTKEMGFDGHYGMSVNYFDLDSLKTLYPEFKNLTREDTEFYKLWLSQNELTGISKNAFAKNLGYNFTSKCTQELNALEREQKKIIEEKLKIFVAEHKDEIYKAQCKAIEKSNELSEKKYQQAYSEEVNKWKSNPEINQILCGLDIAVSTLERDRDLDFINKCLRVGYKVNCASASTVFLKWELEELPNTDDVYREFPFESKVLCRQWYVDPERIAGVVIPHNCKLKDYVYPEYKYQKIRAW